MAKMGKPEIGQPNPFKQVSRYQKSGPINNKLSKADILNRASGKEEYPQASDVTYGDAKTQAKLDKDGFLKLLSFQLQNQDPSKPMDQDKIAADMAQYSQLEQLTNMNSTLTKSFEKQPMQAKFYAASFLGKKVVTSGSTVKYEGPGSSPRMNFKLSGNASKGMVRLFDQKQQMVGEIRFDALPKGFHSIPWNGNSLDGAKAAKGVYRFEVVAYDDIGNKIPAETQAEGVVQSVGFEGGETVLTVDGKKVFLRDVQSFHMADHGNMGHNNGNTMKKAQALYQQNNEATY